MLKSSIPIYFCISITLAPCLSIRSGTGPQQKHLLLRDERGPVLQVTYYENVIVLSGSIQNGTMLRYFWKIWINSKMICFALLLGASDGWFPKTDWLQ